MVGAGSSTPQVGWLRYRATRPRSCATGYPDRVPDAPLEPTTIGTGRPFTVAYVVGVTPGKWARVWGERLPRHPLELRMMNHDESLGALEDGSVDVALVRLPIERQHLSAIPLYEEQAVVVVPKDHAFETLEAVTSADLQREILLDQDWAAAVELVAAGVGVAVMPQSVARALSRRDVIARSVPDASTTEIALVWVTARLTPLVEEFIGIVRGRTANSSRGTPTPPTEKPGPARASREKATTKLGRTGGAKQPGKPGRPRARKPKPR